MHLPDISGPSGLPVPSIRPRVDDLLKPHQAYLVDQMAHHFASAQATSDLLHQAHATGLSRAQLQALRDAENQVTDDAGTVPLPMDDPFETYLRERANRPASHASHMVALHDAGDWRGAKRHYAEALDALSHGRHQWISGDDAAEIDHAESLATQARRAADDGMAGLVGEGRGSDEACARQLERVHAAHDAVAATLPLLEAEIQVAERAGLSGPLDQLHAVKAEKLSYLDRLAQTQAMIVEHLHGGGVALPQDERAAG